MLLCSKNLLFRKGRQEKWTKRLQEVSKFLREFITTVGKKKDNTKHELNSLRAFLASLECHCSMKAVHLNMSHTLARLSSGEIAPQRGSSIPEKKSMSLDSLQHFIQLFFFFSKANKEPSSPFLFFRVLL